MFFDFNKYGTLPSRSGGLNIRLDLHTLILPFPSLVSPLLFIIFRRICNKQEKLFIQWGRFSFFSDQNCQLLLFKKMTAVGLGQQGSQAVGSGFESLACQIFFYDLSQTFFDTRNKWNTKEFHYEDFQHCEKKKFQPKILILPLLLSINLFVTRNFMKRSTEGLLYEMFRYCETKQFRRKNVNLPLLSLTFSISENNETLKDSPTEFFGTVRQKKFARKSWYSPPPLLSINFAIPEFLWNRRVPPRSFSVLWDKRLRQNHDAPCPSHAWKFPIQEFFWNTEGVSYEVSWYCETKIFDTKSWYLHLMQNFFSIFEIFWYTELFPTKIFRYRETKKFEQKVVIPPLFHKILKSLVELKFVENLRKLEFKQ